MPSASSVTGDLQQATTRPCPNCHTPVSINASLCPACGETLPSHKKKIRCRRCGGSASAALVVCPHCGRELQPAPPRLLTWGAPLVLILLFAAVLLAQPGGAASPATWAQRQIARVVDLVDSLGARLQPDITLTTIPVANVDKNELVSQAPPTPVQVDDGIATQTSEAPVISEAPTETPPIVTATAQSTATTPPSPMPEPSPTPAPSTPTLLPTATTAVAVTAPITNTAIERTTPAVTPTGQQTILTITLTATATLTTSAPIALALPTPTPVELTPTATPNIHRIRPGDTLFELAMSNDISLEALLAANGLTEDDVYTIQPGDDIIIPDPNAPTATATPTPTLAPDGFTYTVRAGDTLMAIGIRYGVNIQRILDANGMTLAQARTLRPGQELIIPGPASAVTTPQPTEAAPTSTPISTPTMTAVTMRLDAPTLRTPENGVAVQCGSAQQLVWNPVLFIQSTDLYVVHLGYVNGRNANGAEQVVWVLAQPRPFNVTLWQLDDSLCGLAPMDYGRQWRWYVDVAEKAADDTLNPVSPPSPTWGFVWQ